MTKAKILLILAMAVPSSYAQLDQVFVDVFNEILITRLQLSPGAHSNHFIAAADRASSELSPALNALVSSNVSSFPSSSTSAGVTFDFSSGQPVKVTDSLGPIFGDIADTLGKGKMNLGMNHSVLGLERFRGIPTNSMRFTFTHVDVSGEGSLGENPNESDTIDVAMGLDLDATITGFFATYGVSDDLDVGVSVPFVTVSIDGRAVATVNSFTYGYLGEANHLFNDDPMNPELQTVVPYSGSASGLGDLGLRLKYRFLTGDSWNLSMRMDVQLPTGDEKDYLGSGSTNIRVSEILSRRYGDFRPHVNIAYEWRSADFDSDELEIDVGFDHKVTSNMTFAGEVLGSFDTDDSESIQLFPGVAVITDQIEGGSLRREVDLSNIPERTNDDAIDALFGMRYAIGEKFHFIANLIVPLNDGGLRSNITPTIGLSTDF